MNHWSFDGLAADLTREHCPKVDKFKWGYIYVVELSNGWVKVGRTADPVERFNALRRGLRSTGVSLGNASVTRAHINFAETEKIALAAFEHAERDGEFFVIPVDDALAAVSKLSFKLEFTQQEKDDEERRTKALHKKFEAMFGLSPLQAFKR